MFSIVHSNGEIVHTTRYLEALIKRNGLFNERSDLGISHFHIIPVVGSNHLVYSLKIYPPSGGFKSGTTDVIRNSI